MFHQGETRVSPSDGSVRTSLGQSSVVNEAARSDGIAMPPAPSMPAGAMTVYDVLRRSGVSGVSVTTVEASFQLNVTATLGSSSTSNAPNVGLSSGHVGGRHPCTWNTSPASTEARSMGWLNAITTLRSCSTNVELSCGLMLFTTGRIVVNCHATSSSSTPSVAEVSPAGIRTRYSVLGRRSVGMKR